MCRLNEESKLKKISHSFSVSSKLLADLKEEAVKNRRTMSAMLEIIVSDYFKAANEVK